MLFHVDRIVIFHLKRLILSIVINKKRFFVLITSNNYQCDSL